MPLFERKEQYQLKKLKEIKFKNEREIQSITEQSLNEIFRLEFVKTEFSLNNLRIDILVYDQETKSLRARTSTNLIIHEFYLGEPDL